MTFGSFATGDTVSSPIADTNWHHIAVTFTDATNLLNIYIDGALATTATKALEADGASHVVTVGNLLGNNPFSGAARRGPPLQPRLDARRNSSGYGHTHHAARHDAPERCDRAHRHGRQCQPRSTSAGPPPPTTWASPAIASSGARAPGCSSFVQIATPAGTTFGDTSLTASTSYSYRVKAVDAATNVSVNYSTVASATTPAPPDTTPPSDVTGLTATAVSATQITLSWTAATDNVGVTGYRVERCQGAGCTSFVQIATPPATTFGDTGLTAATSYSYRVKAVDAATNVSVNYSTVASATTPRRRPTRCPRAM